MGFSFIKSKTSSWIHLTSVSEPHVITRLENTPQHCENQYLDILMEEKVKPNLILKTRENQNYFSEKK